MMPKRSANKSLAKLLAGAMEHHRAGRVGEAESGYRKILARDPRNPDANNLLGLILLDRSQPHGAAQLFRKALAVHPRSPVYLPNLADALAACGLIDEADAAYADAYDVNQGLQVTYNWALLCMQKNRFAEAADLLRHAATRSDDPRIAYLADALNGRHVDRPPRDYVTSLFDGYAARFDEHLMCTLEYDVPRRLGELAREAATEPGGVGLDLGCGTGLFGVELRQLVDEMIGCDLSPRMLARAEDRELYDALLCEDLLETLARFDRQVRIAAAADVFIYVGRLDDVFAAASRALEPGGHLLFSTEDGAGERYRLLRSGRYSHAAAYIDALAGEHGFEIERRADAVLRAEDDDRIEGHLYRLRRR